MPDGGEMYANLMRSPGTDSHFNKREVSKTLQHPVFRPCRPSAGKPRGHPRAAYRVAGYGLLDAPRVILHISVHQSQIEFLYFPPGELGGKGLMRSVVLCHKKYSAGEAIQTVNDARPVLATDAREVAEPVQQSVYECSPVQSRPGMDGHARRLVDRNDIPVLIQNRQRDFFRFRTQRRRRRGLNLNDGAYPERIRRLGGFSVH
jgi:hypothetical protein